MWLVQSFAQAPHELLACPVKRCGRALHQPDVLRWIPSGKPKWLSGAKQAFQGIQTGKSKQMNLAVATLLIIRQLVLHPQKSNMFYLYSLRNSRPLKGSERWFISVWTGRQIISCCWCSQRENKCRDEEMNEWQQCGKDAEETLRSSRARLRLLLCKSNFYILPQESRPSHLPASSVFPQKNSAINSQLLEIRPFMMSQRALSVMWQLSQRSSLLLHPPANMHKGPQTSVWAGSWKLRVKAKGIKTCFLDFTVSRAE